MDTLRYLFGEGKYLATHQMCVRSFIVFITTLVLIRISGRRSFGIRTPLDNIIVILLGALLSRGIVGASPLGSVVAASFILVILHRLLGWVTVHSPTFGRLIEGEKICLYKDGSFIKRNMNKGIISEEDAMQGVRKSSQTENLDTVERMYIERNGEISVIKKQ